jgi:tetratricopeptide (TPR) repeat protein
MPRICARCGRVIPPDQSGCDCTAAPRHDWLHSRETILLVTFAVLAGAFGATAMAGRFYHDTRRALAGFWLQRGSEDLRRNRPSAALSDLQTALIYARQDVPEAQQQAYSLNLAQALVANHRLDEAHAYLLDLWESTPDSAKVNLELAHLAVEMGDDSEARRYYANAIYGIWDGSTQQVQKNQRDTQLEFCRYLIDHGDDTTAQSVLLAVAASLPPDPALHTQIGGMMIETGANNRALEQFQKALELDRRNHEALVGAGLASFAQGDDRAVVRYLGQASREKPQPGQTGTLDPRASRDLSVATADLALDTFVPGLTTPERARRAEQSYEAARVRLEDCAKSLGVSLPKPTAGRSRSSPPSSIGTPANLPPAPSDMQMAYTEALKMQSSAREADLVRNPQLIDSLTKLVIELESVATARCGPPVEVEDEALARIAQRVMGSGHE